MRQLLLHQQDLLMEGFEELYMSLKKLEIAQEELHQQKDRLTTAYELVEVERQRYQELFELFPDAYLVTDRRGIILEANSAAATLLNVPQRFLVRKPLAGFISREERRGFFSKLTKLHSSHQQQVWEMRLQRRNSNAIDATLTVKTVHDREGRRLALSWLLRDITKHKQVSDSALCLLRDAVQQAKEPIVITSAELNEPGPRIVFVNQAFTQMTGYSMEEIGNKTPRILQGAKTDRSVLNQLRCNMLQEQPFQGEIINYRKDGGEYKVQISCSFIRNESGEITHYMSIQQEIPIEQAVF